MKQVQFSVFATMVFAVFCLPLAYAQDRSPINVNIIIDSSASFTDVKSSVTTWVNGRLDQILKPGDRITVWSAGASSRIVYNGTVSGQPERDAAKKSVSDLTGSGTSSDLSGALRDAANAQGSGFNYTLLISASPAALSSLLSGQQSSLMHFSRVQEFSGWRAIVIGLNMDARIRRAAAAFFQ